jgi:ABC-type sugar transport system substrate-binding protein
LLVTDARFKGFQRFLDEAIAAGADIKYAQRPVPGATMAEDTARVAATLAQQNPGFNVLMCTADWLSEIAISGLRESGMLPRDLIVVGIDGDSRTLGLIAKGKTFNVTVQDPMVPSVWGSVDDLNRIFAGEKPLQEKQGFGPLLFTRSSGNFPPLGDSFTYFWDGENEYEDLVVSTYRRIWGK